MRVNGKTKSDQVIQRRTWRDYRQRDNWHEGGAEKTFSRP